MSFLSKGHAFLIGLVEMIKISGDEDKN